MALPKLNETPKYEMTIPSTGKKVKFRPYLVKEEKILMMAGESQDSQQIMSAIFETISACVQTPIDIEKLTTFDLEYMFIQLRSKSVGENSTLSIKCDDCGEFNDYTINLDQVKCEGAKRNKKIKLDDSITVEMRYPGYYDLDIDGDETEMGFKIVSKSIEAVLTEDERILIDEEPEQSVRNFLESMTQAQFEKITSFLTEMPQVKHEVNFNCSHCGTNNNIELKGLQSFF